MDEKKYENLMLIVRKCCKRGGMDYYKGQGTDNSYMGEKGQYKVEDTTLNDVLKKEAGIVEEKDVLGFLRKIYYDWSYGGNP